MIVGALGIVVCLSDVARCVFYQVAFVVQFHLIFRTRGDREAFVVSVFSAAVGEDEVGSLFAEGKEAQQSAESDAAAQATSTMASAPMQSSDSAAAAVSATAPPLSPSAASMTPTKASLFKSIQVAADEGRPGFGPRMAVPSTSRKSILSRQGSFFQSVAPAAVSTFPTVRVPSPALPPGRPGSSDRPALALDEEKRQETSLAAQIAAMQQELTGLRREVRRQSQAILPSPHGTHEDDW